MLKNSWGTVLLTLVILTACATKNHTTEAAKEAAVIAKSAPIVAAPAPAPVPTPAPVLAAPIPSPQPRTAARMPETATKKDGAGIHHEKSLKPLIPARDFCIRGAQCGSKYGAYGYIVFTRRPTTDLEQQRYLSICGAYLANLDPTSEHPHIASTQIATTFWLLASKAENESSCDELIDRYDYARATEIATSIRRLGSVGPILVASGQPDVAQMETQELLIIDMGGFASDDMIHAFSIWKDSISQDQRFWGRTFNFNLIVTELRSFIRTYGTLIVQIINIKPS